MTVPRPQPLHDRRARFETEALPLMPVVYRVARRLRWAEEDAKDLVQETYLRAYRTFDAFQPGTNCRAWLLTILYSVFINRYRKAQREPEFVPADEERLADTVPDEGQLPDMSQVSSAEIDAALTRLPEPFRAAVLLVDVEELSYEEAAQALSCPVGTIRSRLFRARKLLFAALQEYARKAGYLKS